MFNFKEKYNRESFLNFLQNNFLPDDFIVKEESKLIDKQFQKIKKITKLGEVSSLGKNKNQPLIIYEVKHQSEFDPRVTLTKEAFWVMKADMTQRALMVFHSINSDNYRLSLMTIDLKSEEKRIKQEYSNPRRYSFYLGPDAKTKTPQNFLIKKGRVLNFEDILKRFSVEVVTDDFFNDYKRLFKKLVEYLESDKNFKSFTEKHDIGLDNFAKKLLGQIVFIYFLQRKKWLGAKKDQNINQGDSNFLRTLYIKCENEKKNYFNDVLEHLFYNAFNKESERASNFYREYFDCQIPFLNGGLFEPLNKYAWEDKFLYIPNELFSNKEGTGILDIFDLYNFTIDENSLIDQEVSVDPEMLGKVFEKLLDTNKKTGAFYTPREIVSYMVKQSLIEYLKTKTEVKKDKIEKLINEHYTDNLNLEKKEIKAIEKALIEVKIIDPAVGSGAFPVGILQEITRIRLICQSKISKKPQSSYSIKKQILENNIYGVDIDHGAIDIARLRFWLSLIVDADLSDIEPLPNLDFKLVAANSLLNLKEKRSLWDEEKISDQMQELRNKYFQARTKNSKEKIQNKFKELINKNHNLLSSERQKQIITYNPFNSLSVAHFFDPEFMFGIEEGFDIVIGNPPYNAELSKEEKKHYKKKYIAVSKGRQDTAAIFIEFAYNNCKKGTTAYILPYRLFSRKRNHGALQKFVLKKTTIKKIIYLGSHPGFKTVNDEFMILIVKNQKNNKKHKIQIVLKPIIEKITESKTFLIKQSIFIENQEININYGKFDHDLLKKIEKKTVLLSDLCEVKDGIIPYIREKLISNKKIDNRYVKFTGIAGKYNLDKYFLKRDKLYLCYDMAEARKHIKKPKNLRKVQLRDKKIFLKRKIITSQNSATIKGTIDEDRVFVSNSIHSTYLKDTTKNYSLEFILACMNSSISNYYYNSKRLKGVDLHPQILITNLKKIPIPKIDLLENEKINKVENLVRKIIKIKASSPDTKKIKTLEKKIDKLIAECYGLNSKDIATIKNFK